MRPLSYEIVSKRICYEYHATIISLGGETAICERELRVAFRNLRRLRQAGAEAMFATSH